MKKRVLSFLLACFMVASTFIISRPLVDVHAVENVAYETWNLPTDWTTGIEKDSNGWDMPYNGVWKLLGYTNLDTASPKLTASTLSAEDYKSQGLKSNGHGKLPGPYLATNANETAIQTTNQSIYDSDGWYVNWNQRWSGKVFGGMATTNGNGIYAIAHAGKPGAITFTAPSNGLYSYTETVEQVLFLANSINLTFDVTVRKNGLILTKFSSSEENKSATLAGEVYLEAGDKLMFAFQQTTSVTFSNNQEHKSNDPNCIKITDLVVKKISDNTTTNYSMPLKWNNECEKDSNGWAIAKQGAWRLTSFNNPSDISTITWSNSTGAFNTNASGAPTPWMNNLQNVSGRTSFYLNNGGRWANGTIFNTGVEGEYLLAIPYGTHRYDKTTDGVIKTAALSKKSNPTVLFTAPVSGEYAYSEIMQGVTMTDVYGTAVTVTATVRKNGEIIDTVTISSDAPYASNGGTVALEAGDFLMFVFVLDQQTAVTKDHTDFIRIYAIDVALVASVEEGPNYKGNVEIPVIFDGTSLTDKLGNVTLMGYDIQKEGVGADKLYTNYNDKAVEIISGTSPQENKWIVVDPAGTNSDSSQGTGYYNQLWTIDKTTGKIVTVGGAQKTRYTGSAFVFTAPQDGIYKFEASLGTYWSISKRFHDYIIMKGDGTVLVSVDNIGKGDKYVTNITATAALKANEQVLILKLPNQSSSTTEYNISCNGSANIVVTELTHSCSAATLGGYTEGQPPFCAPNINGYYTCYCGAYYKDADAAEEITDDGHDWNDGYCADCDTTCQHEGANVADCQNASVCPICAKELAPIDRTNHVKPNGVYVNTGKGTHRYNHICCDYADVAEEKCVYGTDDICDKCGYDNTILGNATINKNNAFNNAFNGGTNNVTVVGPTDGLIDYAAKVIGTEIDGVTYTMFNIHHDNNGNVVLRHHFLIEESGVKIYVNGTEQALTAEGNNYYFFDITPVLGKYDVADEIKVVLGDASVAYTVSLYSYIKVALADTENTLSLAQIDLLKALYDLNELAKPEEQTLVAMANQNAGAGESGRTGAWIDVYDISTGNMNTPVWTYDTPLSSISGFKFRNVAPYGNVVLVCVGTQAEMVAMDTKEVVWSTNESSNNSHSIDILPNGVIVSGGTSDNTLTFFNSADGKNAKCLLEFSFPDAHGVLWDPTYEVVWVVGVDKLTAYKVTLEEDGSITAVKDENLSVVTPESGLHDLQPYFGRDNCLIISTAHNVYIYDIANKTFESIIEESHVKGVGVLPNGDIIYMYWDGLTVGSEAWNTTYIKRMDADGNVVQIDSNQGRFYKCRVLNFNYQ